MARRGGDVMPRKDQRVARRDPLPGVDSAFRMMERFADEVDRVFDQFGVGRSWLTPRRARAWSESPWQESSTALEAWAPDVEVFQRENELVVRADLPGLTKDDVKVDVTDESIVIQGERRREQEFERNGIYRSERSYGSFRRIIPLPQGAITDQAKATFKDGVLQVTMPTPPEEVRRGRRLDIGEAAEPS